MSKSKKFKTIKDHTGLKTGKTYIRAVINCHGKFWFEMFKVTKKPTLQNVRHMGKNWMFDYLPMYEKYSRLRPNIQKDQFVSSYVDRVRSFRTETTTVESTRETAVFPFSNKVLQYLKDHSTSMRDFLQAINPDRLVTESFMLNAEEDHKFQKYMDDESHRQLMESTFKI